MTRNKVIVLRDIQLTERSIEAEKDRNTLRPKLEELRQKLKSLEAELRDEDDVAIAAKVLADACVRAIVESEGREMTRRERIIHDIGSSCFNNLRALQQDGGL